LLTAAISAAIWAIYSYWPQVSTYIPQIGDAGAILITGMLAAIVAVWGIYSQRAITRRQVTLEHIARLESDGDLIKARKGFKAATKSAEGIERFAAADKEDSDEVQAIATALNEFELISIGIQRGIIDFELYSRWYRSGAMRAWADAKPFVDALRHRRNNPIIYHEFEEMVRWFNTNQPPKRSWGWGKWF
jgi:hypothetical protein